MQGPTSCWVAACRYCLAAVALAVPQSVEESSQMGASTGPGSKPAPPASLLPAFFLRIRLVLPAAEPPWSIFAPITSSDPVHFIRRYTTICPTGAEILFHCPNHVSQKDATYRPELLLADLPPDTEYLKIEAKKKKKKRGTVL